MRIVIVATVHTETRGIDFPGLWGVHVVRKHVLDMTCGQRVVMGRKTYEDMPFRPLRDRANLVFTRQDVLPCELTHGQPVGIFDFYDLENMVGKSEVFVIGGQEVFELMLPQAHELRLTLVSGDIPQPNCLFPPYQDAFECTAQHGLEYSCDGKGYRFTTWERKKQ